jgi:hypothetical protein
MVLITCDYFFFFVLITKIIIITIKNNAVPTYAKKLSSGLGKKNRTRTAIKIIPKMILVNPFII